MALSLTDSFAGLALADDSDRIDGLDVERHAESAPSHDFRTLVRLVNDNERLFAELESIQMKIRAAWAYLAEPGHNPGLALTHLDRLRMKRSAVLSHLRANRIEARALLGRPLPGDEPMNYN